MAEELIGKESESIRHERQNLRDAGKQLKQANDFAAERDKTSQKLQELRQRTERSQAQIDAIQEGQGSNIESETELHMLKQLKKNLQTDFESKKKELAALEKQVKTRKKNKQGSTDSEQASRKEKAKENKLKERLYSTKP